MMVLVVLIGVVLSGSAVSVEMLPADGSTEDRGVGWSQEEPREPSSEKTSDDADDPEATSSDDPGGPSPSGDGPSSREGEGGQDDTGTRPSLDGLDPFGLSKDAWPGALPAFCDAGVEAGGCSSTGPSERPVRGPGPADDGGQTGGEGEPLARAGVVAANGGSDGYAWAVGVGVFALLAAGLIRVLALLSAGRFLLPAGWRLDREQVVSHPIRSAILAHLEKQPGATTQELADAAGVRNTRAVYHLFILQREDCVSERRLEGRKHFFLAAAPTVDASRLRKRRLARRDRPPARVLDCLARSPGATVSQVARMLGFSPGHAHYHLSRLEKKGLLDRLRRGRRVRHYLTRYGHEIVAEGADPVTSAKGHEVAAGSALAGAPSKPGSGRGAGVEAS